MKSKKGIKRNIVTLCLFFYFSAYINGTMDTQSKVQALLGKDKSEIHRGDFKDFTVIVLHQDTCTEDDEKENWIEFRYDDNVSAWCSEYTLF